MTPNTIREVITSDLCLVEVINNENFNILQCLPPNVKINKSYNLPSPILLCEKHMPLHLIQQSLSPRQYFLYENYRL